MSDVIIGIDLGTTTTEAAVFLDGAVKMIPNGEGRVVTPSVVGVDESGALVVGERARAQYILAPERTAIEFKRKMGTQETFSLGKISYTPVQLSAQLLTTVRAYASEYLGQEVTRAVISVPAYFDDVQRRDVMQAGAMAGFTVERIINEPTAAALSYGLEHMEDDSYLLVYDLGGGTFDVTLLELFDGVLDVQASAGDNALGGKDFDACLMEELQRRFEEKTGVRLEGSAYAAARLKEQAEQCKIALSTQEQVNVRIPMLAERWGRPLGLDEVVTRAELEQMIRPLIARTHEPIRRVLEDADVAKSALSSILLVGGSTRVPLVTRDIQEVLGMAPSQDLDPDYSVARGAAILAGMLAGAMEPDRRLVMTDVCAYTLGVRAIVGTDPDHMSVIIPRNTTIPVTRTERYSTSYDNQEQVKIEVYQGESSNVHRNHPLGDFDLSGIPEGPAGAQKVDVSFTYNLNGMLKVTAVITSTGKQADLEINLLEAPKAEEKVDVSGWKNAENAADFRSTVRRGERFLREARERGDEDDAREMEDLLYHLKKALLEDDPDEAASLELEILSLMN